MRYAHADCDLLIFAIETHGTWHHSGRRFLSRTLQRPAKHSALLNEVWTVRIILAPRRRMLLHQTSSHILPNLVLASLISQSNNHGNDLPVPWAFLFEYGAFGCLISPFASSASDLSRETSLPNER